jgi:hypothetical protein
MIFRAGYNNDKLSNTERHLETILLALRQESGPMEPFRNVLELTMHAIREARDGRPALLDQLSNVQRCA